MRSSIYAAPLLVGALLLSFVESATSDATAGARLPLLAASIGSAATSEPAAARSASSTVPAASSGGRVEAYYVPDESEVARKASEEAFLAASSVPVLANNQILAFYGNPNSRCMGILGEYPKEELAKLLKGYAKLYDDANGPSMGVVPSFYIIYGTCWPEGEIGYLKDSTVLEYIEFAASQGMLVFIDHQIGKYTVDEALTRLLPFAKYPNVHFALDPEWRTLSPMKEIGSITAEELNQAQATLDGYLAAEGIPGTKMLVVHQFRNKMISGRSRVRADFGRVILIHTADGFGSPTLKRNTYAANAAAPNMPLKGFKLFFKTKVQGAGYDEPLLTPPEVLALDPMPMLVIYQ